MNQYSQHNLQIHYSVSDFTATSLKLSKDENHMRLNETVPVPQRGGESVVEIHEYR